MSALHVAEPIIGPILQPARRLSDGEVVAIVGQVFCDPRAWDAADLGDICAVQRKDAIKRALRLLREALETV